VKLFIVEDDPVVLELMIRVLGTTHEVVLVASSKQEALELIPQVRSLGCDMAIIDSLYGGGKEVAEMLRAAFPGIKVVAYSVQVQEWEDMDIYLKKGSIYELLEFLEKLGTV